MYNIPVLCGYHMLIHFIPCHFICEYSFIGYSSFYFFGSFYFFTR